MSDARLFLARLWGMTWPKRDYGQIGHPDKSRDQRFFLK